MSALRYTLPAILLHWMAALLLLITFPLGLVMADMRLSPAKLQLVSWHKWLGVTVVLLAVLRLLWRATHRPPAPLAHTPRWQRLAAAGAHAALYALMLAVPLAGWLYSSAAGVPTVYLGLWQLPDLVARDKALAGLLRESHELLAWALAMLVAVHVGAALHHQFVRRDGVLQRMNPLGARRGGKGPS